jgi:propionyl-CoA carboxylase alpha chain
MTARKFGTLLIANRGEIAVRVIRTCRELGIRTVAVFSTADRLSPHVLLADEAVEIGPPPASESYLRMDKILAAAVATGADAIHPGYGFLAENPEFAEACEAEGMSFVGPPPDAIRAMGDKTAARRLMESRGVPMVPGTTAPIDTPEEAAAVAEEVGFPVLLKAAAGGGGKGMRIVRKAEELGPALEAARRESSASFGDERVFLEKFIVEPRHVEFQILADHHGSTLHLFERECSIQRRHQKVIEEAPSPALSPDLRERMGAAAVAAAEACGYRNAGTVEFLLDDDKNFYFMEMNTRLQVEHPVTEWITGLDLVAQQIRIAEGEPLEFRQDQLSISGHSIECRVYAEDPLNGFLPDPGRLVRHELPGGPGVRVDAGVVEGGVVASHYDPLISKLTSWASTRQAAIDRMRRALDEYDIAGVSTTIPFCRFVMNHGAFRSGEISTRFIERYFDASCIEADDESRLVAALGATLDRHYDSAETDATGATHAVEPETSWSKRREFR